MSANAIDLFAGVNVAPPTANGQVLVATAAGTAGWSNTIGAGGLAVAGGMNITSGNLGLTLGNINTALGGVSAASLTASGLVNANGGTNSSGSAPVIAAPGFANGVASQLSDLTRDYVVYFTITAAGTVFTIAIGPTSGVANTIVPSSTVSLGESFAVRLPAGWFLKWSATTATVSQIAIGC